MQKVSLETGLKSRILQLELEQAAEKQQLKDEFRTAYQKIKKVGIVASAIKGIISSSSNNVMIQTTGVVAGYLIKKIVVGKSENKFRKILGSVLQFGATGLLTQNPKIIEKAGAFIMQFIPHKNKSEESTSNDVK